MWGLSIFIAFSASRSSIFIKLLDFTLFSVQGLFLSLFCGYCLLTGCWKRFGKCGIWFSTRCLAFYFNLFIISLLAMSIWGIFGAHTLKCLVISIYPINILFQVLYIFDLKRFFKGDMHFYSTPKYLDMFKILLNFCLNFFQNNDCFIYYLFC